MIRSECHGQKTAAASDFKMSLKAAIGRLSHRLDGHLPDRALHFELVRALYCGASTAKAMLGATIAALTVMATAAALSGDIVYRVLFAGFLLIGGARSVAAWSYTRTAHNPEDADDASRWELFALAGAWSFSGLVGLSGLYSLTLHAGTDVEMLIDCCVMGYIAGISSRNASRPLITIGQISCTCVPFMLGLMLRSDLVHIVLAAFVGILYVGTVLVCRSVFETIVARHEAHRRVEMLAQRDVLTGLWNRAAFLSLLDRKLTAAVESCKELALIAIDLDRFKDINDTLGHPIGDAILKQVATRICSALKPGDEVSRIGGDEFLIMLSGDRAAEMMVVAASVLANFAEPFVVDMTRSVCGASIGCAIAPQDGATLDVLLRNADLALYESKRSGRGQAVKYAPTLSQVYESRVALEHDLQFALANGELGIVYQPIVDPRSGRTICCEALLRWNHPVLGAISPAVFIPIAETTGLIVSIGSWVLTTACAEAMYWGRDVKVAVNLSPVQFRLGREIVDVVIAALKETGLQPDRLELEITESVLIDDGVAAFAILEELRGKGISIALDDFGTGFASLAYLSDFAFSKIKIDQKFSQDLDHSSRTSTIIKATAQICRELHIECVAEGIETEAQLERMRGFGINAMQGFLFSKPLPPHELRELIGKPIVQPHRPSSRHAATATQAQRRKVAF
jgi:diguanylate cyclase (GGDEF)-like protein